ncbi:protein-disulfide reductase DsbD family protein [Phenylobacterium sp. LjRoot219]|uniref:protein-disulfide reductase DsbD family protein n=1 Tax=Phenylobacterium sp. LjRoot219 TaxID=3342283 RepID=UPI003ECD0C13
MARLLAFLITLLALAAAPAFAAPVDTGHLTAELMPQTQGIAPGQTIHVALRQKIDKGWHTYWRNSGDSGEPTQIAWTLPTGWKAGDIVWAAPSRQPTGPLMNYGYSDEVLLPVAVTAPADARPGEVVTLKAHASFLVCEEICVPEDAALTLDLPITAGPAPEHPKWGRPIAQALAAAPRPAGLTAAFARGGEALQLAVTGAPLKGADAADAYFFPFDGTAIDHAKPQAIERGPEGLTLTLAPGVGFQSPTPPAALAGVLVVDGRAYEISASAGALPAAAAGLGAPRAAAPAGGGSGLGLAAAALFAFLGGVVLNLMPCVFPVLAMKATSLARHADQLKAARAQGLAFLGGVLATFLALAVTLIAVRAGGAAVGWGFQLQSPPIVAGLALLMLAVALNLSGTFEIGQSLQGAGTGLASRRGLTGAFFTGALAVVVAAPCTAPFMGPAMGWALTQSAPAALVVFAALGLGFAAPFTLAAFAPGLLARLPKPGPWMESFRRLMAFPMYGAAAWLAWVLTVQAGSAALARILAAGVVLAFAAWLFGRWQKGRAAGRRPIALAAVAAAAGLLAVAAALTPGYQSVAAPSEPAAARGKLAYEPWSAERLAAARAEGRPVFVNFTAAWCVSCQVNEKVALSTDKVARAFATSNAVYLKGDWTRKDAVIEAELARHGRAGVPLYLVYGAKAGDGVILPQLLTADTVVRALEAAQSR